MRCYSLVSSGAGAYNNAISKITSRPINNWRSSAILFTSACRQLAPFRCVEFYLVLFVYTLTSTLFASPPNIGFFFTVLFFRCIYFNGSSSIRPDPFRPLLFRSIFSVSLLPVRLFSLFVSPQKKVNELRPAGRMTNYSTHVYINT